MTVSQVSERETNLITYLNVHCFELFRPRVLVLQRRLSGELSYYHLPDWGSKCDRNLNYCRNQYVSFCSSWLSPPSTGYRYNDSSLGFGSLSESPGVLIIWKSPPGVILIFFLLLLLWESVSSRSLSIHWNICWYIALALLNSLISMSPCFHFEWSPVVSPYTITSETNVCLSLKV